MLAVVVALPIYFVARHIITRPKVRQLDASEKAGLISKNQEYQEANRLSPDSTPEQIYEYYFNSATTLSATGYPNEAIVQFQKAAASGVKLTYSFYVNFGLVYELKRDYKNALGHYRQALSQAQNDLSLSDDARQAAIFAINENIERVK